MRSTWHRQMTWSCGPPHDELPSGCDYGLTNLFHWRGRCWIFSVNTHADVFTLSRCLVLLFPSMPGSYLWCVTFFWIHCSWVFTFVIIVAYLIVLTNKTKAHFQLGGKQKKNVFKVGVRGFQEREGCLCVVKFFLRISLYFSVGFVSGKSK